MAVSVFCRKCLGFGVVSRIGPSTRPPSATPASNRSASAHLPVAIIVVAATVSALVCLCIIVLELRSVRRRRRLRSNMSSSGSDAPLEGNPEPTDWRKSGEGEEEEAACNEGGGRRSNQQVEQLVVMAGEEMPTFLAHPVPASSLHIQCPPLHL